MGTVKLEKELDKVENPSHIFTWKGLVLLAVSVGLLVLVAKLIGVKNITSSLLRLKWEFLVVIVFFVALMFAIEIVKFGKLVEMLKKVSLTKLLPVFFGGMFVNALTPGARTGGEFLKAYYLSKLTDKSGAKSLSVTALNGTLYGATYCILAFISIGVITATIGFPTVLVSGLAFVLVLFSLSFVLTLVLLKKGGKIIRSRIARPIVKLAFKIEGRRAQFSGFTYEQYIEHKVKWIDEFVGLVKLILKRKDIIVSAVAIQIISCFVYFSEVFLITQAFGVNLGIIPIIGVTSVSMLFGYFMILPGGIGVTEAAMVYLYPLFGVNPASAAAITLIDRSAYYLVVFGGGYASLMFLGWKYHIAKHHVTTQ